MKKYCAQLLSFYLIGFAATLISYGLNSFFLLSMLRANLISFSITLFAINIATIGILSTKIYEISKSLESTSFLFSIKEMRKSVIEQVVIITMSIVFLIIDASTLISFEYKNEVISSFLSAMFFYNIFILWDSGNAIFILLRGSDNSLSKKL